AGNAEIALVLRLAPEFAQDGESRVAAVADDVVAFARTAGDRWWGVKTAFADGSFDLVVSRISSDAGVEVVRAKLIERHHHRCVGDRIVQRVGDGTAALESVGQQLRSDVLRRRFSHRCAPCEWAGPERAC